MSVRRLAEGSVQPDNFAFNRANGAWAKRKIKDFPKGREASAVIPLLMRAQEQEGWVTKAAIEYVADMLNMPLIRVLEVATFYTQFQLAPVGKRAHIQVCGTTPCMLRGANEIMDVCKKRIAPNPFELSEDGNLSWEEVECQGACVNAPMVMIFKDSYEDLTPTQMEHIIDRFDAGKSEEITPGPQIERVYSAPEGGLTSLLEKPTKPPRRSLGATSRPAATSKTKPAAAAKTKPVSKAKSAAKAKPAKVAGNIGQAVAKVKAKVKDKVLAKAPTKAPQAKTAPSKPAVKKGAVKKTKSVKKEDVGKPQAMKKPTKVDDLKLISGVGPKIEGILHELGVYKFEQIGKWKKAERSWVDNYLSFKGRIDRDEWVKQAKALAKKAK